MKLVTISEVSRTYGLSTRTLRYWEQIGLIESRRGPEYAYRIYDERALLRLRQILALRRLRVPLKHIGAVLRDESVEALLIALMRQSAELAGQIAALDTVRMAVEELITRLRAHRVADGLKLLDDEDVVGLMVSIPPSEPIIREERRMEKLDRANDTLNKLTDVRILWLPEATVAASHIIGDDPEDRAGRALDAWVMESGLLARKPDLRHYGFNHPNPVDETGFHGYEFWVTIPDDMEVPAPLMKKRFAGGLYAAHMIRMGNFHEWEWLFQWVQASDQYEFAGDRNDGEHMFGSLEEHLNYVGYIRRGFVERGEMQLDLLIPVREKA